MEWERASIFSHCDRLRHILFWLTYYYASMIKTDAVNVKQQKVIGSYADVLTSKSLNPMSADFFDEYLSFKNAEPSTMKGKIWQRVLDKGFHNCFYALSITEGLASGLPKLLNHEAVAIIYD